MKNSNEKIKRFLRIPGIVAVLVFGILSIVGSGGGGGGDDDGGSTSGVTAFNFNAVNTENAAQLAAAAMSFFPIFTDVGMVVIDTLVTADPNNSPFDLAICSNAGTSILSWTDGDASGDASVGDVASLAFTSCDIDGSGALATGTVSFLVDGIVAGQLPSSVDLTVSVNLDISAGVDSTSLAANFSVVTSTQDNINFTNAYTADDLLGQKLAVSENGSALFQFGCFSVTQTFNAGIGVGTYGLAPGGVINANNYIMSLAGGPSLSFVSDAMEAGTKRLLSLSVPSCAAVGVPNGVGDSDGSYVDMVALGGGNIRLNTYDIQDMLTFTMDTTWFALLN